LRFPGHAELMAVMRDIGLMGMEPIEVKGVKVVPRDVFISIVGPKLKKDYKESPDQVALRVEAEGIDKGEHVRYRFDLLDRYDADTGITAMMRTTGFSLAITGAMQAAGKVKPGVWTPDEAMPGREYIAALAERGVVIQESRVVLGR
ncbi:MAG TPA: saccharopine dehydrogenase C-terminal domain-containing protein, partial [Longimicrobium sp.]|nr:saccharopine dehydrogenase C-terminal domain-containing protein [Longimicrobium sp.]